MAKKKKDDNENSEEENNEEAVPDGADFFNSATFKKYKKDLGDFAVPLDSIKDEDKGIVKTCPSLDISLNGGLTRGQLVQIAGKPKTGKTTLAFLIAANFQKQYPDKMIFYYKVEGRLSSDLVQKIEELDTSKIIVIKSSKKKILSGIDFLSILEDNMRNFTDSLHIIDSIGGITGEQELSGSMKDQQRGELGKLLAKFCRRNSGVIDVTNSLVVCLNHVRDKMDASGRGGVYSPGGKHWTHQLDTDIMLSKAFPEGNITLTDGTIIGHNLSVEVKTTTRAAPNKKVVVPLIYGRGICVIRDVFKLATDFGIVEKAGAWISYKDEKWQGLNNALEEIYNNRDLFNEIKESVFELIDGMEEEE